MKYLRYIAIIIALVGLFSCNNNSEKDAEAITASKVKKAENEAIPEMSIYNLPSHWTNQNGEEIELKELQGKVVVMVMIYTTCKAACPRLVADMRNIEKQVPEEKKDDVQYVFGALIQKPILLKD